MSKPLVIPVFIPHLGCRHSCIYCDQKKIAGEHELPGFDTLAALTADWRAGARDIAEREVQLAFYGGSFTGLAPDVQSDLLRSAARLKADGLIDRIRLSTRPDYMDEDNVRLLAHFGADIIELGVQSMADDVLELAQRGHTAEDVRRAAAAIRRYPRFTLGLQMMIALPGDTPDKSRYTAERIAELAPDFVRIYPTAVLKGTQLAWLWEQGEYQEWPWEMLLDTAADVVDVFGRQGIPVIRIGLQAADNLKLGGDLLAGAYHPALGELVKGRLFRRQLEAFCRQSRASAATVYANPRELSQVVGQKRCNLRYCQEQYGVTLSVKADPSIASGQIAWQEKEIEGI